MNKMVMKIIGHEFELDEYQANFLKDKKGNIISISFPIDGFYEFVEDVEDTAYLEGCDVPDSDKETVSHKEVMEELGLTPERIKEIRKETGLTQEKFGEQIGYAAGTIRNIETGQNKISPRVQRAVTALRGRSAS